MPSYRKERKRSGSGRGETLEKIQMYSVCGGPGGGVGAAAGGLRRAGGNAGALRRRGNASDQFLEIVSLLDLDGILRRIPGCEAVVTTGQKATDALLSLTGAAPPPMGGHSSFPREGRDIRLYRMPSSSRAYPKPLEEKAGVYRKMFQELKML